MTQKSRWRAALIAAALLVPILAAAPLPAVAADGAEAIHTYRATPGDVASEKFKLKANGVDVFVAKYANRSNNRMAVARFASSEATPTLTITADAPITSWKIHPAVHYPTGAVTVSGNTLSFAMSDAMRYVIVEVNGTLPGIAIVNDPPEDPAKIPDFDAPNVVDVTDYVTDTTGATDQTTQIAAAIDAVYSDDSKDTLVFPDGWYQYAGLDLRDRTKPVQIYVDEGALLKNRMQPTMEAMEPIIGIWDSANITISGRGVFDGNGFANYDTANGGWRHDAATSQHQGGVMLVRSQNIVFNDTLARDAKQWNWETHTAKNVTFNNIKGLTPYAQPWIDGIDLASGQDVTVNGALTLGNDDNFASGHYNPSDKFLADPDRLTWDTEDTWGISVNDHLGWSAGAGNGIRIGHVWGYHLRDYSFDNVHYAGFSAGGHGITIYNLTDAAISVRNSSLDTSKVGTNFAIAGQGNSTATQRLNEVVLENVSFSKNLPARVQNTNDLRIRELTLAGERITRATQTNLTFTNVVNRDLDFVEDVAPVIAPLADAEVLIDATLEVPISVTDGDGDAVQLAVESAPDGAAIDGTTLRWTPTATQVGVHSIVIRATDERGASSTATFKVTVVDPDAEVVELVATADASVQSWNAEQGNNYGDNELVRMLNFNDPAFGPLGSGYAGNQSNRDAKLTYLTFDLGEVAERITEGDLLSASLSLTYAGPTKGTSLSGTNTLKVAAADTGWIEGNGKTTPPARANTIQGGITWLTKPAVDTTTVLESAPFDVTGNRVGSDGTYSATQRPIGSVASTNVTSLVEALAAGQTTVSFAVNETKKQDIVFVSREGAERNPNAAGMAPKLTLTLATADNEPPLAVAATATTRCVGGKVQLVGTVKNHADEAISAEVDTAWGTRTIKSLKADATTSLAVATRSGGVDAGSIRVTATGAQSGTAATLEAASELAREEHVRELGLVVGLRP
jgi:hypothetical protein